MRRRRGQALILLVLALPLLLGMAALSLTVATVYLAQARLQNAVAAGALAGAQALSTGDPGAPGNQASLITADDAAAASAQVTLAPAPLTVAAHATATVPATFAAIFGIPAFHLQATAWASWSPGPAFAYAIFQADAVTTDTPLTFNGADSVAPWASTTAAANVHSNNGLTLHGAVQVQGACTASASLTNTGHAVCTQGQYANVPSIPLPTWSLSALAHGATHIVGSPTDPTGLTLSGSTTLTGRWLVYGPVTISGSVTGPGSLVAVGGSITLNGSNVLGGANGVGVTLAALPSAANPAAAENITANGSIGVTGVLYAPTGSVIFNGNDTVTGAVVGHQVTLNGSVAVWDDPTQLTTVPIRQVTLVPVGSTGGAS